MLQDRVDQLDLAFLPDDDGDDDASVLETKCRLEQQSVCKLSAHEIHAWNIERSVVGEAAASTLVHDARMRSTSIDCVARKIQTVEYHRKRSRSLSDTTDMLESPYYSLSRKNSLGSDRSCLSRDMSRDLRGIGEPLPTDATLSISSSTAVSVLSDTEAIRRFVLDDVKSVRPHLCLLSCVLGMCSNFCNADVRGKTCERCPAITFPRGLLPKSAKTRCRLARRTPDCSVFSTIGPFVSSHVHTLIVHCSMILIYLIWLLRALFNNIRKDILRLSERRPSQYLLLLILSPCHHFHQYMTPPTSATCLFDSRTVRQQQVTLCVLLSHDCCPTKRHVVSLQRGTQPQRCCYIYANVVLVIS